MNDTLFNIPQDQPSELALARARYAEARIAIDECEDAHWPSEKDRLRDDLIRAELELNVAESREIERLKK